MIFDKCVEFRSSISLSYRLIVVLVEGDIGDFQYNEVKDYFFVITHNGQYIVSGLIDIFEDNYMSECEIVEWFSFAISVDVVGRSIRKILSNVNREKDFNIIYKRDGAPISSFTFWDKGDCEFFGGAWNNTVNEWNVLALPVAMEGRQGRWD